MRAVTAQNTLKEAWVPDSIQPQTTHLSFSMKETENSSLLMPRLSWASCRSAFPRTDSLVRSERAVDVLLRDWLGQQAQGRSWGWSSAALCAFSVTGKPAIKDGGFAQVLYNLCPSICWGWVRWAVLPIQEHSSMWTELQ